MPHVPFPRPPVRTKQNPRAPTPAVAVRECPACGRQSAVVFHLFYGLSGARLPAPPPVCLTCCTEPRARPGAGESSVAAPAPGPLPV